MAIFVNHQKVERFSFSAGECHVRINPHFVGQDVDLVAHLIGAADILDLLLAVDAIRRVSSEAVINLTIPYFPYGRQDKIYLEGEPLSIKVIADLINSLKCNQVKIFDPHSDVTSSLLKNCITISLPEIIAETEIPELVKQKNLILLAPDAGAKKKVEGVAKYLLEAAIDTKSIFVDKYRDIASGQISFSEIQDDIKGKDIIIIDDICDGGQTFVKLAKKLRQKEVGDLYLYVTHGIFSNGIEELSQYFKHIYCYFSIFQPIENNKFLTVINPTNYSE